MVASETFLTLTEQTDRKSELVFLLSVEVQPRGVAVEVGEEEAAIDLSVVVEYGKPIPQVSEALRRSVIGRVENLIGLRAIEVNITVNDALLPEERPLLDQQREVQQQAREQERRA